MAREGQTAQAVQELRDLNVRFPADQGILNDLIVVLVWDGQAQAAIDLFQKKPAQGYPEYVHGAMFGAYRSLGKTQKALALSDSVLAKDPGNSAWRLRRAQL